MVLEEEEEKHEKQKKKEVFILTSDFVILDLGYLYS